MFGITHAEPANPADELTFAHATAPTLSGPWTKRPPALTVDNAYHNETFLWAPHVIAVEGTYYMFYAGGGSDFSQMAINLATSTDLYHWTRLSTGPLFRDGYLARDPMVVRVGNQWVMYYTANSAATGGNYVVAYRTSTDLIHWSERDIAFTDLPSGECCGETESPFVVHRDGWWYLFIGPRVGYVGTDVFASRDPLHFDISNRVGHIPSHAAEVMQNEAGQWRVSSAGWGQGGVYLADLNWHSGPVTGTNLYALTPNRNAVMQWSGSGTGWIQVGGPATKLYTGGFGVFATNPVSGDIYRYSGSPGGWTRVGSPGSSFAVNANGLFGLTPDRQAVYQWSGSGTEWTRIGGPATEIYAGGTDLFATNPVSGDIYHYRGSPQFWTRVGGPGAGFTVTDASLFGLTPGRSGVAQWSGTGANWTQIGGPADSIAGGR